MRSPYQRLIEKAGPALYWRLGETSKANGAAISDFSGNGREGAMFVAASGGSAPTLAAGALTGDDDGALSLDGTRIAFGYHPTYSPYSQNSQRTYEAWVYWDAAGNGRCILGGQSALYALQCNLASTGFYLDVAGGLVFSWGVALPAGRWVHVALTVDTTGTTAQAELFFNAVSQGVVNLAAGSDYGTGGSVNLGPLYVGTFSGDQLWNGDIDELAIYHKILAASEILAHYKAGAASATRKRAQISSRFRVLAVDDAGQGYELTRRISGLQFSNVKNGGDETATFSFHTPWRAANPEVAEGNDLVIFDGLDVLWQGEIDEADRSADGDETLAVTAYGKGAALKRDTYTEIWIDRDLGRWGEPSTQRQINLIAAARKLASGVSSTSGQDSGAAGPGITQSFGRLAIAVGVYERTEMWYFGGGVDIGKFRYDFDMVTGLAGGWSNNAALSTDDIASAFDAGTNHDSSDASTQTLAASAAGRKYAVVTMDIGNSAFTADYNWVIQWKNPVIEGRHGLAEQGTWPDIGFFATQIIANLIGRVAGLTARQIDQTNVVITQRADINPTTFEDGIAGVTEYHSHERTFGTWGPNSPLEPLGVGQFDYTTIDGATDHWTAMRADCDSLGLQSERSALFNRLIVNYTDESGMSRSVTATTYVAELGSRTQTKTIDGGKLTDGAATALAAAMIRLYGGFAPARGSVTFSKPLRHYRRGTLAPHRMRADGSNLRIPDVLPSTTLFELSTDPDRRTTFPIQRVTVDASGPVAKTTVELDQTHDAISALLAREAQAAELVGA